MFVTVRGQLLKVDSTAYVTVEGNGFETNSDVVLGDNLEDASRRGLKLGRPMSPMTALERR